jgi:hypothetical protein
VTKRKRERDPLYETAVGRLASTDAIGLRRWIHQRWQADPEALPGRFRYYEAIMAGVIDKHAAQAVVNVEGDTAVTAGDVMWQRALAWVREMGLVPDGWIEDRTRQLYDYTGYKTVDEGIKVLIDGITIDPWKGQWPLLVIESESSAAALETIARQYRVMLAPLRGQSSRSYLANVIAPKLYDRQIVLVVVDLDKVGGDISDSAKKRLEEFSGHSLDWRVIALTDAQVRDYSIVRVPRTDGRETNGPTRMVAETEALGATNLRQIVRDELDALLPESLVSIHGRERAERAASRRKLA